jgi:hypothetical protein
MCPAHMWGGHPPALREFGRVCLPGALSNICPSFGKESGSGFSGRTDRPRYFAWLSREKIYSTREPGTFFHATLRPRSLRLSSRTVVVPTMRKKRRTRAEEPRTREVLVEALHRELCTCSCSTRKNAREEKELNTRITISFKSVPPDNCFSDIKTDV